MESTLRNNFAFIAVALQTLNYSATALNMFQYELYSTINLLTCHTYIYKSNIAKRDSYYM
jgi:hypothetical protein